MRPLLVLFALVILAPGARAEGPTADEILEKARRSSALGLLGARAEVKLVVAEASETKQRSLTAAALREGDVVRRLVRFTEPADVRGVAFLVVEKPGQAAERFLYLPAQKRVRRVSANQGTQALLGTDFAYADLELAGGVGDAHERLADATVEGGACWRVETRPASGPYAKIVTAVHQQTGVAVQIEFFGPGEVLAKRLKATRVKQLEGRWYAFDSVMETIARGSKTTLTISKLDPHANLAAEDFTEAALERP